MLRTRTLSAGIALAALVAAVVPVQRISAAPDDALPDEDDGSTYPKLAPTRPPTTFPAPLPVTAPPADEDWIKPTLMPTSPPR